MADQRNNRINYVELPATKPEATRAFFESVFGWEFTAWGDDYLSFKDGRMDGGFFRSPNRSRSENGATLVVLYHDELEPLVERVKAAGGSIAREIFEFPGGRRFHFYCPSGNEFAVWSE